MTDKIQTYYVMVGNTLEPMIKQKDCLKAMEAKDKELKAIRVCIEDRGIELAQQNKTIEAQAKEMDRNRELLKLCADFISLCNVDDKHAVKAAKLLSELADIVK